jgi:hypothetical protein
VPDDVDEADYIGPDEVDFAEVEPEEDMDAATEEGTPAEAPAEAAAASADPWGNLAGPRPMDLMQGIIGMDEDDGQAMTICPECGEYLSPGAMFCPNCGSSF